MLATLAAISLAVIAPAPAPAPTTCAAVRPLANVIAIAPVGGGPVRVMRYGHAADGSVRYPAPVPAYVVRLVEDRTGTGPRTGCGR